MKDSLSHDGYCMLFFFRLPSNASLCYDITEGSLFRLWRPLDSLAHLSINTKAPVQTMQMTKGPILPAGPECFEDV